MPLRLPTPSGLFLEGEEALDAQAVGLTNDQKKALLKLYHALLPMHGLFNNLSSASTLATVWNSLQMSGIEFSGDGHLGSCFYHGCPRPVDASTRVNPGFRPGEARLREIARRQARAPVQPEPPEEHDEDDYEDDDGVCADPDCENLRCRESQGRL